MGCIPKEARKGKVCKGSKGCKACKGSNPIIKNYVFVRPSVMLAIYQMSDVRKCQDVRR